MSETSLWIFGYGSLVWRPAFPHLRACRASIGGYTRRFWQGSTDHRGVPGQPGRVVTLLACDEPEHASSPTSDGERCWGVAYEILSSDPDEVLSGLDHRERGGYQRLNVEIEVWSAPGGGESAFSVMGLVYVAGPNNDNYLGEASIPEIANQIASASGPSGANPEYVLELANRLRQMRAPDAHVFAVEAELKQTLALRAEGDRGSM